MRETLIETISIDDLMIFYNIEKQKNKFLCPFHGDKRAGNFSIKGKKWKCFSCGAGGNVIDFVMLYENLKFKDAMKKLAEYFGVNNSNPNFENSSYKIAREIKQLCIEINFLQNVIDLKNKDIDIAAVETDIAKKERQRDAMIEQYFCI